jgi:methyl-accepting chemotaxis protein
MHYIIIILVVVWIVILQISTFVSTCKKISVFKTIFPKADDISILYDDNKTNVVGIKTKDEKEKKIWDDIKSSINKYLENNKGSVSDFHLMKDIIDRNCDAKEEEIHTQIPVPLYLGLAGTMAGILIGVGYLVFSGGLNALLSTAPNTIEEIPQAFKELHATLPDEDIIKQYVESWTTNGREGVISLLGGVAIAMFSSICGIALTTCGSLIIKNAKATVEKTKNDFLTWMQANLLPQLSNDTAQTLQKLSQNLTSFNSAFSENTRELKDTFSSVQSIAVDLKATIEALNRADIKKIGKVNIDVYHALENCTDEIGKLVVYLKDINQYQANTTDAIEKMQKFFALGIEQIDSINVGVKNALERFGKNTETYLGALQEKLDGQILNVNDATERQQVALQQHFDNMFGVLTTALKRQQDELLKHFETVSSQMQTAANEQQEIFKQKLKETTALVDELKNLSAIKSSMNELIKQTSAQSQQISQLTEAIKKIAEMKASDGVVRFPMWIKIAGLAVGGSVGLTSIIYIFDKIF